MPLYWKNRWVIFGLSTLIALVLNWKLQIVTVAGTKEIKSSPKPYLYINPPVPARSYPPIQVPIPSPKINPSFKPAGNEDEPKEKTQQSLFRPLDRLKIFGLINKYRVESGRPPLDISPELCNLAEKRVDFLISNNEYAARNSTVGNHIGLDEAISSYSGTGGGENIAGDDINELQVLEGWQKSPLHNELMLWTEHKGVPITKGCVATRSEDYGSVTVLEVGDK